MCLIFFMIHIRFTYVHGILGGNGVNIESAPFQVNYGDRCGAVLIQKTWALTTAHCGTEGSYIRVGSKIRLHGRKVQVLRHLLHPKYQFQHEFDYDIQLLQLYRQLHFGKWVNNIRICGGNCGKKVRVYGWGYLEEKGDFNEILQEVTIEIVPKQVCQKVQQPWYNDTLTASMFCAEGHYKDACQGDSGGAAVSSGQLVGISSFGYGCGRGLPGVYINVTENTIRKWITYYTKV